jgi:protoheme IX farnesyltransferase
MDALITAALPYLRRAAADHLMAGAASLVASSRAASAGDFFALLKPRVMSLVVFTGFTGIVVAPGHVDAMTAFTALLCIAVGAGASGALNMAYDSDIDAVMRRTAGRPIPSGRIARSDAIGFGWVLAVGAVSVMGLFVNALAASLLAFTILFYVAVYTLWLKRLTPQNIVIGGLAGALPPAIGWAAVSGTLSAAPLALVLLIFVWTPPHFWALSLFSSDDYARAGVPMLPVVRGKDATRRQIFAYAALLSPVGMLPGFLGLGGALYASAAALLGLTLVIQSVAVLREKDPVREPAAHRLFGISLAYVFVLFSALIVEHVLHLPPLGSWM